MHKALYYEGDPSTLTRESIAKLAIVRIPFDTMKCYDDVYPELAKDYYCWQAMDIHTNPPGMKGSGRWYFDPKAFDPRFKHPLSWYKAAMKSAVEMEDFEEAAALKLTIKEFEAYNGLQN